MTYNNKPNKMLLISVALAALVMVFSQIRPIKAETTNSDGWIITHDSYCSNYTVTGETIDGFNNPQTYQWVGETISDDWNGNQTSKDIKITWKQQNKQTGIFTNNKHDETITIYRPENCQKITICHRTNSVTNPYNIIEVAYDGANGQMDNDHTSHTGDLASSEAVAQALKDQHLDWGDIIPSYYYGDGGYFPGLNWSTDGQAIWNNNCQYISNNPTPTPTPTDEPTPTPTDDPEPTDEPTPTPTPTCNPGSVLVDGVCHHPQATNYVDDSTSGTGGASSNSDSGQVLGATTTGQVLGASTLAGTGTATENLALASMLTGGLLAIISLYANKKAQVQA